MMKLTFRERELIRKALRIASEDGSIFPPADDPADDDKLRDSIIAEIETIRRKLNES